MDTDSSIEGTWIDIGVRVVRGPDWSPDFGDQDGGEGNLGTVVEICGIKVRSKATQIRSKGNAVVVYRHGLRQ